MKREGKVYSNAHGKCVFTNKTIRRQPPSYEKAAREIVNHAKTQHQMTARMATVGATHVQMLDKKPGMADQPHEDKFYRTEIGRYLVYDDRKVDVVNYASERELTGKLRRVKPHVWSYMVGVVHPKRLNHEYRASIRKDQVQRAIREHLS
jgi:hypothetical protein